MLVKAKTIIPNQSHCEPNTESKPSRSSRRTDAPFSETLRGNCNFNNGSNNRAEIKKEMPFKAKARGEPRRAMMPAPSAGPKTRPRLKLMLESELALGK